MESGNQKSVRKKIKKLKKPQIVTLNLNRYQAAVFDMDGVITQSARVHAAAWKQMFDEYLRKKSEREVREYRPFDDEEDYHRYVDGKPRYEGARSFLDSRAIAIPYGDPSDPPGKETVCGLGNLKNRYFLERLKKMGVDSYPSTLDFIKALKNRNKSVAVISSSRSARAVLDAAGVRRLFHVIVDGKESAERDLNGKPDPDIFLTAAKKLETTPEKTMIIEDALAGVEAGRAGGFALVIGIDRSGQNKELKSHGADIVVRDLSEIRIEDNEAETGR